MIYSFYGILHFSNGNYVLKGNRTDIKFGSYAIGGKLVDHGVDGHCA